MTAALFLSLFAACALVHALVMFAAWRKEQETGNAGWIDVFWSFGTGGVAAAAALTAMSWRSVLIAALALGWSLRLGGHLLRRTRKAHDDPRYAALRKQWGERASREMLRFALIQAAFGALLAMAIVVAAWNPGPLFRGQDLIAVLIICAGLAGEALSDAQVRRFKADSGNKGRICVAGLWTYSRHPNYFFEWLVWLSWPVFAIDFAGYIWGWFAIFAPVCMYWLLTRVSGIPPLEAVMVEKYGDEYRAYQARVSPFFPRLPRAAS